ncbi:MAG: response regulator transcription factor [Paludibacteraceae bacterium]|jgi:DNA-binding NarL/FixJ family response regulator|nr:response regulator transcription factor [Paludibacteraceae bacterium]MDI9536732.1 LuxR C-terminal-related transcriptional regulator [Bacteroidota bacterium]OQC33792.1 MAG: Response regulator protein VraR [Bacteroidetes bacterium ADurb.Bin057]HHT60967.1 response regulator transcription factor [Bacteroidales bacterium]MBP9039763.1 response regulator transcription factor [Paludibacteraceae bacterium]
MNANQLYVRVAIAEKSTIVRNGLIALLNRIDNLRLQIIEIASPVLFHETLTIQKPNILIINPQFEIETERTAQQLPKGLKTVALITSAVSKNTIAKYEHAFSIYDDEESICAILHQMCQAEPIDEKEKEKELSQREKEIVIGVAKGLTNKEIANLMHISTNTVITHRRNIASKLCIHSPAGLTIYAIVNNLIDITEI